MKTINIFLVLAFSAGGVAMDVAVAATVQVGQGFSLYDLTRNLGSRSNLVVCFDGSEHDYGKFLERNITVEIFTNSLGRESAALNQVGLHTTISNGVLLVTGANELSNQNNILNTRFDSFSFKGGHAEFLTAFREKFRGDAPGVAMSGPTPHGNYNITMSKDSTAREVLMLLASRYRVTWTAKTLQERPKLNIRNADGSTTAVYVSSMMLTFSSSPD